MPMQSWVAVRRLAVPALVLAWLLVLDCLRAEVAVVARPLVLDCPPAEVAAARMPQRLNPMVRPPSQRSCVSACLCSMTTTMARLTLQLSTGPRASHPAQPRAVAVQPRAAAQPRAVAPPP